MATSVDTSVEMKPLAEEVLSRKRKYQGVTPRIERLKEAYFQWRPTICLERALAYTRAYKESEGEPSVLRRAKGFRETCASQSITIYDDELIVGNATRLPRGGVFCPEITWSWLRDELDTISTRNQDPFLLTDEQKEILVEEIFPYWEGRSMHDRCMAQYPEETRKIAIETGIIDVELKSMSGAGEVAPGYGNILLPLGFKGIKKQAQQQLKALDPANPADYDRIHFLRAVIMVCDSMKLFASRYAKEASRLAANEEDPARKQELEEIADICSRVPFEPPQTFREALQTIWFGQIGLFIEENAPSYSPGRMDQYLYPYYKADLEAGRLTKEEAQELLECLWIKMSEMSWLLNANATQYFTGYMPFQNVNAGGVDRKGNDATNELSYMFLQATMDVQLFQPSLAVRIHNSTPQDFLLKVAELVRLGTGFPAIHFDDTSIKMMLKKGVEIEDARDYCLVGCVEPNVGGKMSQWSDGGHYNFGAAVEFALFDGVSLLTGKQLGLPSGDPRDFESYDEFAAAVKKQISHFIRQDAIANLVVEKAHQDLLPKPFQSCLVEDCVDRGLDVMWGGARYNAGPALILTGVADLSNSLAAVKKLVYEEEALSIDELCEALEANFEGYEDIRQLLINRAPKYGNDDDYVDKIAQEFTDFAAEQAESYTSVRGCQIINGLYPVSSNVPHGLVVGALPSGRKARKPLADGCSPNHGTDTNGPTAAIKSVDKLNHENHTAGTLLNQKLSPAVLEGDNGLNNLVALLRAHNELGGYHVQFNVISNETLRDAQKYPERYRGLLVRVAGYSAYFTELCEDTQNDIIGRTEHARF